MSRKNKLWQRLLNEDQTSRLVELDGVERLDPEKPVMICLPGVSTTHDKLRAINGYMGVAEKVLGGRPANGHIQLLSISYANTEEELANIERSNDDPLNYYSDGAREFAQRVIAPLLERGIDVNLYAKSFGPVLSRMAINALNEMGITPEPHQVRLVTTGNVARLNFDRKEQSTAIYIEGSNDRRAAKLNRYKMAAPSNHERLTITPLTPHALHVLTWVPESITFTRDGPGQVESLERVTDSERHTTRLYSTLGRLNRDQVILLQRVARNMLRLKGEEFTIESCLRPADPFLAPGQSPAPDEIDSVVTANIAAALERGKGNQGINAVLFDWDLTLIDAEKVYLRALNGTFEAMKTEGFSKRGHEDWAVADMRKKFFPTTPEFFRKVYGEFGDDVAELALQKFRELRAQGRSEANLLPGAKELLGNMVRSGVPIAIVSNKDREELEAQKALLLPEPEFANLVVVGKVDGKLGKPAPDGIHEALARLGIPDHNIPSVMFVGDQMRSDITAALDAGCKACLVGTQDRDQLFSHARNVLTVNGSHAVVQDKKGREILHFPNLISLRKFLDGREEGRAQMSM